MTRFMALAICITRPHDLAYSRVPYDQPENSLAFYNEWLAQGF